MSKIPYSAEKKALLKIQNREKVKNLKTANVLKNRPIRIKQKMDWLLAFFGTDKIKCSRCKYCGSFKAIQLHHLDPKEKLGRNDSLSYWLANISFENFKNKILNTNFIFICANCHFELHEGVWKYGNL